MFLKCHSRFKDGKEHRYWNIVENRRCGRGKFVQRQVLYLGEINDTQRESWCRTIEIFDENRERPPVNDIVFKLCSVLLINFT
jgi:hypothetical protein